MKTAFSALKYLLVVLLIAIVGGLAGWYFYLHIKETDTATVDQGRGLTTAPGSFQGTTSDTGTFTDGTIGVSTSNASSSAIWQVDKAPVAGMHFIASSSSVALYYTERANGYLFSVDINARSVTRLTDTLMPKIYAAQFTDLGSVVMRSINADGAVTTFLGKASASTSTLSGAAPDSLTGFYLQNNIKTIALNPKTGALFYIIPSTQGGITGIMQQWDGTKKQTIFSSNIGSWQAQYLSDNRIILTEGPVDSVPGYSYSLSASGALSPIVRDINGLTELSAAGSNMILYGSSSGGMLSLYARATSTIEALSAHTIADKCVWVPKSSIAYCAVPTSISTATFLAGWYQGTVHTADVWWKIDASTGQAAIAYTPSGDNVSFDVIEPTIDPSGSYVAFMNASDGSLWVWRVAQ